MIGANAPTRQEFQRANTQQRMRIISQIRQARHGNLQNLSTESWLAQVNEIASELGWTWPAATQEKAA